MVTYPADWQRQTIGGVASIIQGGTPSTLVQEYWDDGITWVTPTDITSLRGMRISKSARTISQLGLDNSSAVLLPADTILLCSRATIGALALSAAEMATNQGFKNLICKAEVDPVFLAYLLSTKKDEMLRLSIGTTFLEISKSNLAQIDLQMPSFPEQRAIAEVLSVFDEHLANLDELITKKKAIRDGALEGLVTRGKHPRHETEVSSWISTSVGALAEIKRGASPRPIESFLTESPDGINWIKIGDAPKDGIYISQTSERITREGAANSVQVNPGDLILSNSMSFGRPYILQTTGCIHDGWLSLQKFSNHTDALYLLYLLSSKAVKLQYSAFAAGSGVKNLNKEVVGKVQVDLPPLDEQRAIAEVLSGMDEEIRLLAEERAKVERLKLGAMDDLLTGRVRLPLGKEAA